MLQKTKEQEFTYRASNYTPQAPIAGFVNFLSKHYYEERDEAIVEVIRRAMAEFTNDAQVRMNLSVFSNQQIVSGKTVMNEQYTAMTSAAEKMFSVCIVSADEISADAFEPTTASLHPVHRACERYYFGDTDVSLENGAGPSLNVETNTIQFVSIYHQLQNLVRTLSDKLKFFFNYDREKEVYYLLGRPIDQAADEKDRFQVLIRLNIPVDGVGG